MAKETSLQTATKHALTSTPNINVSRKKDVVTEGSASVQKSIQSFTVAEEKPQVSRVEQMQGDINRILVMLESLTIPDKNKKYGDLTVNHDVTAVLTASNLLEVKHPDVVVDILEDGCKVTCNPCKHFQLAQQKKYL